MRLEVRGLENARESFVFLWGKYVKGFDSSKHCAECRLGDTKSPVNPKRRDGDDYKRRNDFPYFYLFGMGRGDRSRSNLHFAVEPRPGSVASIGSIYGVSFTIYDAFAPRIDRLPKGWMGLDDDFTTCRNFQFGVQMFGYHPNKGLTHPGDHSLLPIDPKQRQDQQA